MNGNDMSTASSLLQTGGQFASLMPGYGSLIGGGMQLLGTGIGMFGEKKKQDDLAKQQEDQVRKMQQAIKSSQDQAVLRTFPVQGVSGRQIYAYGGEINDQIDIPDTELTNNNSTYYQQRIKEIGLDAATQEYESFFGEKPQQQEATPLRILRKDQKTNKEPKTPKRFSVLNNYEKKYD